MASATPESAPAESRRTAIEATPTREVHHGTRSRLAGEQLPRHGHQAQVDLLTVHGYDEDGKPAVLLSTVTVQESGGDYFGSSDTKHATLQIQNGGARSSVGITVG